MDFDIEDVDEAQEEVSKQAGWDQFQPILQTFKGLDDGQAIVVHDLNENTTKNLRSFLHYHLESDAFNMRQRKQPEDGTIKVAIE